jgi:hypothetical protein
MDLEWRRWNSANYKLRHDEAIEMADITYDAESIIISSKDGYPCSGSVIRTGSGVSVKACRPTQMPPDRIPNTMNVVCSRRIC